MTSRLPYWFAITKKRQPYWILLILSSILQDVTAAILVYWNKEKAAILDLLILSSFLHDVTAAILIHSNKETVAILDVINIEQPCPWRHGRHIGLLKQRNGGHIGSCSYWIAWCIKSRPPYWFVETKKRWPYWILLILSSFLHDVTAAILI